MNDLRQKIKEAINTTLVVQNKQSIDICLDKLKYVLIEMYGYFPESWESTIDNDYILTFDQWHNMARQKEWIADKWYIEKELKDLYEQYLKEKTC